MNENKLRIVFMGTPDCARPFLEYLAKQYNVTLVCTAPDKKRGRNMEIGESGVKKTAAKLGLKIFQPEDLKSEETLRVIKDADPDALVIIAYGYKLNKNILSIPKYGSINIHFSLLPDYRGASPAAWAIVNGETKTGVTGFILNEMIDAGGILCQEEVNIDDNDSRETLMVKLIDKGLVILPKTLEKLVNGDKGKKQGKKDVMYARKLKKEDGLIDWSLSNVDLNNRIRAFAPWPGAYTYLNGSILKFFGASCDKGQKGETPGRVLDINKEKGMRVQCGKGAIWIQEAQFPGKNRMSAYDLFLGRKLKIGDVFKSNCQHNTNTIK
ncbi:MAG: methionyl-tRNA formyltransferase [Elusimicrobiota bacterium]